MENQNNNKSDRLWPLLVIAGCIPGIIIWLLLVRLSFAGEFAGLIVGFGAVTVFSYFGCSCNRKRIVLGTVIISVIAVLTNHLGYTMDIFFNFRDSYMEIVGEKLTFFEAFKRAVSIFVVKNVEGLRKFYLEAMCQGILCSGLLWVVINEYNLAAGKNK